MDSLKALSIFLLFVVCLVSGCEPSENAPQADHYKRHFEVEEDKLEVEEYKLMTENDQESESYRMSWGKLKAEIIEPQSGVVKSSVIWLHGLGASGHDFVPIVPHLGLNDVRFIFPYAPKIPVTINGGMIMPAWYDLTAVRPQRSVDMASFTASVDAIQQLVRQEMAKGIPSNRILLAGFSQGGAVAYQAGLTFEHPLAGILALSTYLIEPELLEIHPRNANMNLLLMHGSQDEVVGINLGRQAQQWLIDKGLKVEMKEYPMAHQVIFEQLKPISSWIQTCL